MAGGSLAAVARDVASSFAAAAEAAGRVHEQRLVLAGTPVALRFAGGEHVRRLGRAFGHLGDAAGTKPPSLTINVWDTASTGAPPPPLPSTAVAEADGALYHLHEPPLRAAYRPGLATLAVLDAATGVAWHWAADAAALPAWEQACPFRQLLFWWLEGLGHTQVHGAAVGRPERGVLVVGAPGAGKSTVALASLASTLLYAGDDYVAVSAGEEPRVTSLYSSGKLDRSHLRERLPELATLVANDDEPEAEKAVVYVHEHLPERTTDGFPLAAVLVATRHAGRETRVGEVSRAAAFAALAPTTLFQLHTGGAREVAAISRLLARVPCRSLELGMDVAAGPATILDLLERL